MTELLPILPPLVPGKEPEDTTVVVAMSGGVDSSVVAGLLHKLGYKVIGITLQLWDYTPSSDGGKTKKFGTCCALDDVYDARRVCQTIGIPHYVLDYEAVFKEAVVDDFVETYLRGETPVPCVRCNQRIKFKAMLEKSKALGADCLVTGHYVRKAYDHHGKAQLLKGSDPRKDQTYFLFATTQEELDFLAFPIGDMIKDDTRALGERLGLHVSKKPDSQDICFVPGGDYRAVVRKFAPNQVQSGNIVDESGKVLGQHEGIINFTVGQRKGLGGGTEKPLYVISLNPQTNEVVVGPAESLGGRTFTVREVNWLGEGNLDGAKLEVRVRNSHQPAAAVIKDLGNGRVQVTFNQPQQQIAPGQAAVFYDGERMLGGGWIENSLAVGQVKVVIK